MGGVQGLVCLDVSRHRGIDAFPGGAKAHLAALVQLGVDQVLRLVGRRLRREVDVDRVELLGHATQQLVLDGQRLA